MTSITWTDLLGLLSALMLAIFFYDLIIARPLRRNVAELLRRTDALGRLVQGPDGLIDRIVATDDRTGGRLAELEERVAQLERRGSNLYYEQAINLAEHGERAERLVSCFGLPEAEADLIRLLHGERQGRAEPSRDV